MLASALHCMGLPPDCILRTLELLNPRFAQHSAPSNLFFLSATRFAVKLYLEASKSESYWGKLEGEGSSVDLDSLKSAESD